MTPPSRDPRHSPLPPPRKQPEAKETPCPEPDKYDMKKDHPSFVSACERYIRLRSNRFPTEESKILWALAYLKGKRQNALPIDTSVICTSPSKAERYTNWAY